MIKDYLKTIKRIVLKIGTKSLINKETELLDENKVLKLVKDIAYLLEQKKEVVLVSSGAIITGAGILGLKRRPVSIPEKQAVASVGQIGLMQVYKKCFARLGIEIGQILLTEDDLKNRERYLNARNTFITLIENFRVVPVVNENDVVGIEEIVFGDNDVLSALVANLVDADLLVILSDIKGFFLYKDQKRIFLKEVKKITYEIERCAGATEDKFGTGGMRSKIKAAKISTHSGIPVIITNSDEKEVLKRIINGEIIGTFFHPSEKGLSQRKRWIAYSVAPRGKIVIDVGAKKALTERGKSLLPSGIIKLEGEFKPGDPVDIIDENDNIIGRGLVNYDSSIVNQIKGKKSEYIKNVVSEKYYPEVIHRDNLVIYTS